MSNQDPSKPQGFPRLALVREDAIDLRDPVDADHGDATATSAPASRGRGPQPVVDLDAVPRSRWRLDTGRVYAWNRRLWRVEQVGCVLCVEHDDDAHRTLSTVDAWSQRFVCLVHGELCEVPYSMRKVFTVRVGDVTREGEETLDDSMLFPADMTLAARHALIEKLLDEAVEEEDEAGTVVTP